MRFRMRIFPGRRDLPRILIFTLLLATLLLVGWFTMVRMPGRSHRGPLPPATDRQRALAAELEAHVKALAGDIGPRSLARPDALERAATYVEESFRAAGLEPRREPFDVGGDPCANVVAEIAGGDEVVIVGAHYDTCGSTPGADDNASGVAGMLALARRLAVFSPRRTIRFVAFVNEEPPYFGSESMGSVRHARGCRERGETVVAMLSLEMLGRYDDAPGSQSYPLPGLGLLYPDRGDFIAFVGNFASRELVREAVLAFRQGARFPSEGAALPEICPGIGLSDHRSFWAEDYPALMVTDTAMHRNPHYHRESDRPESLDYDRMSRVVEGLELVLARLAGAP
jgi:hypothetical protein